MATAPLASGSRLSRGEWRIAVLLAASVIINYVDRSNLSVAAGALGVANALIDGGTKIDPALRTSIGGFFIARYGWRAFSMDVRT